MYHFKRDGDGEPPSAQNHNTNTNFVEAHSYQTVAKIKIRQKKSNFSLRKILKTLSVQGRCNLQSGGPSSLLPTLSLSPQKERLAAG